VFYYHRSFLKCLAAGALSIAVVCADARAQVINVTGIAVDAVNATGMIKDDAFLTHFTVNGVLPGVTPPAGANRTIGNVTGGTTYDVRSGWGILPMTGVEADKVYYGADMTPDPPFGGGVNNVDAYMDDMNIATAAEGTATEFVIDISDINASAIGDGVPDVIMISIAGNPGKDESDIFRLLDADGNPVGGTAKDGWVKIDDWNKIENLTGKVLQTDRWNFDKNKIEDQNKDQDIYAMAFDLGIFLNGSTTAADIANTVTQIAVKSSGRTTFAVIAFNQAAFSTMPEPGSVIPLFGILAAHVLFSRSRRRSGCGPRRSRNPNAT
jgi:hypothetical protein